MLYKCVLPSQNKMRYWPAPPGSVIGHLISAEVPAVWLHAVPWGLSCLCHAAHVLASAFQIHTAPSSAAACCPLLPQLHAAASRSTRTQKHGEQIHKAISRYKLWLAHFVWCIIIPPALFPPEHGFVSPEIWFGPAAEPLFLFPPRQEHLTPSVTSPDRPSHLHEQRVNNTASYRNHLMRHFGYLDKLCETQTSKSISKVCLSNITMFSLTFDDGKLMLQISHVPPAVLQFLLELFDLSGLSSVQNVQLSQLLTIWCFWPMYTYTPKLLYSHKKAQCSKNSQLSWVTHSALSPGSPSEAGRNGHCDWLLEDWTSLVGWEAGVGGNWPCSGQQVCFQQHTSTKHRI